MRLEVVLTADAERDLEGRYNEIVDFDSRVSADHVLDRLFATAESMSAMSVPHRRRPP